ncbi:MAG: substrate-binding domain-containing protein [Chloroflexi bacterium]|nr:substrate-binding domain-containing protein [Chloroflexota bacterium]
MPLNRFHPTIVLRRLLLAALVAGCAGPAPKPPVAPPVQLATTASAAPFTRLIADRAVTGVAPVEITRVSSNEDLLDSAAQPGVVGLTLFFPQGTPLWATPLGNEPLAIVVHPSRDTVGLTLEAVRQIFSGQTAGWQVTVREAGDDSRAAFEALTETRPAPAARVMPSPEAMLNFVSQTPDAIGYLPWRWVTEAVKALPVDGKAPTASDYPLMAMAVAVARQEPTGAVRDWLAQAQK